MPTVVNALHNPNGIFFVSFMKKLKHTEEKSPVQGHTGREETEVGHREEGQAGPEPKPPMQHCAHVCEAANSPCVPCRVVRPSGRSGGQWDQMCEVERPPLETHEAGERTVRRSDFLLATILYACVTWERG